MEPKVYTAAETHAAITYHYANLQKEQWAMQNAIERHKNGVMGFTYDEIHSLTKLNYRVACYKEILDLIKPLT